MLSNSQVDAAAAPSSSGPPRLIPRQAFLAATTSIYTPPSLLYRAARTLVGVPLWWALEQLSLVGGDESLHSGADVWKRARGDYVVLSNLEVCIEELLMFRRLTWFAPQRAAENVIRRQHAKPHVSLVDSLYSIASFRKEFATSALPGVTLSDEDVKILLRHLSRDKRALVFEKEVRVSSQFC